MASEEYTSEPRVEELRWLPIEQITPATDNVRTELTGLDELAASIKATGLLTPVVVEQLADDSYGLVAGARRHAAAQMAGLTELPVLVRSFDPVGRKAAMLAENVQRVNLTPLEEGSAYQDLLDLGADEDALAGSVGRPRAEVDGRRAVFGLPRTVHQLLADEALTYAEALLLTQVAEYPKDIDDAVAMWQEWGRPMAEAVEHVRGERQRNIKAEATREKLTRQKVTIIDTPEHGYLDHRSKERPLGRGWNEVPISRSTHRKEPCHAAYVGRDG
jgi:ParB/RepB/Spo0J family partition protein